MMQSSSMQQKASDLTVPLIPDPTLSLSSAEQRNLKIHYSSLDSTD